MFNFFKKSKPQEDFSVFQGSFTNSQKVAIIKSLIFVAKSDDDYHPKEIKIIEQVAELLGVNLNDPVFQGDVKDGMGRTLGILEDLDQDHKEWYIYTVTAVAQADGKLEQIEIQYVAAICESIGITEQRFIELMKNAENFNKRFK